LPAHPDAKQDMPRTEHTMNRTPRVQEPLGRKRDGDLLGGAAGSLPRQPARISRRRMCSLRLPQRAKCWQFCKVQLLSSECPPLDILPAIRKLPFAKRTDCLRPHSDRALARSQLPLFAYSERDAGHNFFRAFLGPIHHNPAIQLRGHHGPAARRSAIRGGENRRRARFWHIRRPAEQSWSAQSTI